MRTLNIEDGEAELHEYFGSAEYLPAEVKDRRTLMAQDLGNIIACLIAAHGGTVNWSDGSFEPRTDYGPRPVGYFPVTYTPPTFKEVYGRDPQG